MSAWLRAVRFELGKMAPARAVLVIAGVLVVVQPLLALLEGSQIAQIGVDATPATHPELAEALAPVPFTGFDVLAFGEVGVVVLGALLGAADHQQRELRTTLLAIGSRPRAFAAKLLAAALVLVSISLPAVVATIAMAQVGLGDQGIDPLGLTGATWRLIGLCVLYWTALGLCCFALASLARTWIVPLVLLAPLVMGLGQLLGNGGGLLGRGLPVTAGQCLTAIPGGCSTSTSVVALVLAGWVLVLVAAAWAVFVRRDGGTR